MVKNITEIAQKYKKDVEMMTRLTQLEEENKKLKALLKASASQNVLNPATILVDSQEEVIIAAQINLLEQKSQMRELVLDEVKCLDLLLKNKYLIEEAKAKKSAKRGELEVEDAKLIEVVEKNE